ncbi:MAG TPA: hypothetical protein VF618_13675 [Thermoanaerobaculia bacterium]
MSAVAVEVEPVVTSYTEGALARLQELRNMRGLIPHFVVPETPYAPSRMAVTASLPPDFVELAGVLAVANPDAVTRGQAASAAEMRELLAYAAAYAPLVAELEALTKFVRFSVIAARNRAGGEALAIYETAKRLAKRPEFANLAPHVAAMRRVLGKVPSAEARARREAKKAAAQQATHAVTQAA